MSAYYKALDTSEGVVHVLTKTRWMGFIPMPHTSVMRHSTTDLSHLGIFVKWTTRDPSRLAILHEATVRLVEQVGISGLGDIRDTVKMTARVARTLGASWQDVVRQAAHDGVAFPVPDDVLQYIRGFK